MLKKYRPGFEPWTLLLLAVIMLPNLFWFAVPAPNDILRKVSVTEALDTAASICQALMIVILCAVKNIECKKIGFTPYIIAALICCLLYYASWAVYYTGTVNTVVICGLIFPPCLAFLFFAADRKNSIAIVPISVFTVCHAVYGAINFII